MSDEFYNRCLAHLDEWNKGANLYSQTIAVTIGACAIGLRNGMMDVRFASRELISLAEQLEAAAPEVSETRARAEAFDAFLGQLARVDPDSMAPSLKAVPAYCRHWMLTCLAEAKRKGAGT